MKQTLWPIRPSVCLGWWGLTRSPSASVFVDKSVGGVEAAAAEKVAHLDSVNQAIPSVPEIEQVEHLSHIYK